MRFGEGLHSCVGGLQWVFESGVQFATRVRGEIGVQAGDEYDDLLKVVLIETPELGSLIFYPDSRVMSFAWSPNRRSVQSLRLDPSRYCLHCFKTH